MKVSRRCQVCHPPAQQLIFWLKAKLWNEVCGHFTFSVKEKRGIICPLNDELKFVSCQLRCHLFEKEEGQKNKAKNGPRAPSVAILIFIRR